MKAMLALLRALIAALLRGPTPETCAACKRPLGTTRDCKTCDEHNAEGQTSCP